MQGDLSLAAAPFANDAVAGTVVQVKGAYGSISGMKLVNTTAATAYLQVFFKPSASVTLGTTTADWFIRLGANESTPWLAFPFLVGIPGGSGISIAGTTTPTGSTGAAISVMLTFL